MKHVDTVLHFEAESKTVYKLIKSEGGQYALAAPRIRKCPDIPVIIISPNMRPAQGKPQNYIKDGQGNHVSGLFYDTITGKGYGNSRDKKDTLLFDWNPETGKMKVFILLDCSLNGTQDRNYFERWQNRGIYESPLVNKLTLETTFETNKETGRPDHGRQNSNFSA